MTPKADIWSRVVGATGLALALTMLTSPARPLTRLPWPGASLIGVCAGCLLYVAATGCLPRLPARPPSVRLLGGKIALLGLLATNEEILWRRVLLGELLFRGAVAALAASSLAFALAHRRYQALHFVTGVVFGGLYLATGLLTTSVVAHWAYNVLVGTLVDRARVPEGARA